MNKFNQFMMVKHPEYLRLPEEERIKYRMEHHNELNLPFTRFILNTEYNYNLREDEEVYFVMPSYEQLLQISKYKCYMKGIGKNYVHIHETIHNDDITTFANLYDYSCKRNFAEEKGISISEAIELNNYEEDPELYFLGSTQCGSVQKVDGVETYKELSIFSLAEYINLMLTELAFTKLHNMIPSERVNGRDHGKQAKDGLIYHKVLKANGYEKEHMELEGFIHEYLSNYQTNNYASIEKNGHNCIWRIDLTDMPENCVDYVVPNARIAKRMHFETWYEDSEKLLGDNEELDSIISMYTNNIDRAIDQKYQELMKNHSPNVIYLKNETKTILPEFMFDEMNRD